MIQEYHDDGDVIMEMAPYPLFDSFYILISQFSFPCSLLDRSSDQPLCYSLYLKLKQLLISYNFIVSFINEHQHRHKFCQGLTTLEFFETILTAASSLKCSQRPSVANIKNMSCGSNFRTNIEGSAVTTGLFKGTGIPKWWKSGSLLNSGFFK